MKSKDCFAMNLRSINRHITNLYDDALRNLGITINQLNILMVIKERDTLSATDLSEITMLTRSTLSRNLNRLKNDGLIDMVGPRSAKRQPISLTENGYALLKTAEAIWKKVQAATYKILGPNGIELIKNVNAKLNQNS